MQTGGGDDAAWAPRPPGDAGAGLLPGYTHVVQIARGGDSVVYRAHQDALDRDVAIKVIEVDDPESVARFRRELAITVHLGRQHPNIVTVLATGTTDAGQPCLVMDYIERGSLHDRLVAHGPLPVSEVVAAGTVIADALAFAHGQGVLHRDVKPQNVLVLPTSWVLADFGLARAIDAGHSASLERFSYRHASPQVLDGEAPTVADDVYSLGSTLFTLLDGRAPFASADPDEDGALAYLRRARTGTPRPLEREDVPAALRRIVLRCLARDRAERYPDAAALRDALAAVPTEARAWSPPEPPGSAEAPASPASAEAPTSPAPATATPPTAAPVPPDPPPVTPASSGSDPDGTAPPVADEPAPSALAALSALSGLSARPVADTEATGLRPAEDLTRDDPPAPGDATPGRGGRRRWILIGAAAVLALGAGIGAGVWRSDGSHPAAAPPSTTTPSTNPATRTPTRSAPVTRTPSGTATAAPVRGTDPRITVYRRNSTNSVALRWTDPGRGEQGFIVFEVVGSRLRPLSPPVPTGQFSTTQAGVLPGRHCLAVGAVLPRAAAPLQIGPVSCRTT